MATIFQAILSFVSGAVIGALCFSIWLAGLMFIYVSIYDSFGSGGFLFDAMSAKTSVLVAFIFGLIFGGVQGFFVSMMLKTFEASSSPKNILSSLIITELLVLLFFLIISLDTNPIIMISEAFSGRSYDFVIISLLLLVPSIIVGLTATRVISIIPSK